MPAMPRAWPRSSRSGADVDEANEFGATPMGEAATPRRHGRCSGKLLKAGADPRERQRRGRDGADAGGAHRQRRGREAAAEGRRQVDAREKWGGQTALIWAAAQNQPAMIRLLAAKGADVNARSIVRDWERRMTAEERPEGPEPRRHVGTDVRGARRLHRGRAHPAGSRRGRRLHRPGWQHAAAGGADERSLGCGEAADRRRRRREPLGLVGPVAAVHGGGHEHAAHRLAHRTADDGSRHRPRHHQPAAGEGRQSQCAAEAAAAVPQRVARTASPIRPSTMARRRCCAPPRPRTCRR